MPMEFMVRTLETNLNIKRKITIDIMLNLHTKGGAVLPLSFFEEAYKIANSIISVAKENICELFVEQIMPNEAHKWMVNLAA
jgi:ATP-dependent Clp protease adapter protein ClpS